jgi:hypothetical protein
MLNFRWKDQSGRPLAQMSPTYLVDRSDLHRAAMTRLADDAYEQYDLYEAGNLSQERLEAMVARLSKLSLDKTMRECLYLAGAMFMESDDYRNGLRGEFWTAWGSEEARAEAERLLSDRLDVLFPETITEEATA